MCIKEMHKLMIEGNIQMSILLHFFLKLENTVLKEMERDPISRQTFNVTQF